MKKMVRQIHKNLHQKPSTPSKHDFSVQQKEGFETELVADLQQQ